MIIKYKNNKRSIILRARAARLWGAIKDTWSLLKWTITALF